MRKITLFICGLILSFGLQAQEIVTRSKYDVNGDNQTSIADVTEVVNKVLSKSGPEPEVVTAENLNNVLKQINEKLNSIESRLSAIEEKIGSNGPDNGYSSKHEYVDLGLPSGTLWATCNLGASKPEEFGLYYTWGETTGYPAEKAGFGNRYVIQSDSYFNNKYIKKYYYQYWGCEGEIDDKLVLDLIDDAAAVNWGIEWCMPTKDQLYELYTECKWEWAKLGEHYGYNIIGPNNNNIFIPAAGHAFFGVLYLPEEFCILWSSSVNEDPDAQNGPESVWYLVKSERHEEFSLDIRDCGHTIRPVRNL